MALTANEEALIRQLIAQNAALLSLASSEPTIITKLAATQVSLSDLSTASSVAPTDLMFIRQGTTDKATPVSLITAAAASGSLLAANNLSDVASASTSFTNIKQAATESATGVAEIATQTEVNTGTDDARFVTPLKNRFGFAISLAANGYVKFPEWLGGLIIQWGTTPDFSSESGQIISFPIAFPNSVFVANATTKLSSTTITADQVAQVYSITNSTLGIFMQSTSTSVTFPISATWIAIGN